jgi:hypothetical protein
VKKFGYCVDNRKKFPIVNFERGAMRNERFERKNQTKAAKKPLYPNPISYGR